MTMKPSWYQQAIIYEIDVSVFQDSNGDGYGDFRGLTARLDYLVDLGATCLWLQPIFKSPYMDNGYDVTDFYSIDERWGTQADFEAFIQAAKSRNLRVLLDLPVNHTSDQHPWFQEARSHVGSLRRDWYIWRKESPEDKGEGVFGGRTWTYDEQADAYYHHDFYPFQPDLNMANPAVREEIKRIMTHWMKHGVDGFRMDAVPFLIHQEDVDDPYGIVRDLYEAARSVWPDAVLLGEVDLDLVELRQYFGLGAEANQMNMLLNFWLANYLFLAFARQNAQPLTWALSMLPIPPVGGQWANFLRNHDELSLNMLGHAERQDIYRAFAPNEDMRAYGRGPRRRLAPMLGSDVRQLKLAHSLLLTMPGTPVIYYGDEIGMGDDLGLQEREAVRTPMQWSQALMGGFTGAREAFRPVITGGEFGYEQVNVQAQYEDPDSLLCFIRQALAKRREIPQITLGRWRVMNPHHDGVFAHNIDLRGQEVVFVHNLTNQEVMVHLDVADELKDVFGDHVYDSCDAVQLKLRPYGFRWMRLRCDTIGR